jgi:hypothetical protein
LKRKCKLMERRESVVIEEIAFGRKPYVSYSVTPGLRICVLTHWPIYLKHVRRRSRSENALGRGMPYTFATLPFHANALSFSPYNDSLLAVTSSQNFGLVGNGRAHILQLSPAGIKALNQYLCVRTVRVNIDSILKMDCTIAHGVNSMRINLSPHREMDRSNYSTSLSKSENAGLWTH